MSAELDELREALAGPNVSIRLVSTFTHGRGVQVYVKSRKVGPLIVPEGPQTLADVLHMLGTIASGGGS